jgi:hypothetical protein
MLRIIKIQMKMQRKFNHAKCSIQTGFFFSNSILYSRVNLIEIPESPVEMKKNAIKVKIVQYHSDTVYNNYYFQMFGLCLCV